MGNSQTTINYNTNLTSPPSRGTKLSIRNKRNKLSRKRQCPDSNQQDLSAQGPSSNPLQVKDGPQAPPKALNQPSSCLQSQELDTALMLLPLGEVKPPTMHVPGVALETTPNALGFTTGALQSKPMDIGTMANASASSGPASQGINKGNNPHLRRR